MWLITPQDEVRVTKNPRQVLHKLGISARVPFFNVGNLLCCNNNLVCLDVTRYVPVQFSVNFTYKIKIHVRIPAILVAWFHYTIGSSYAQPFCLCCHPLVSSERPMQTANGFQLYFCALSVRTASGLRCPVFAARAKAACKKQTAAPFGCRCPNLLRRTPPACKFGRRPQLRLGCFCRRQRLDCVVLRLFLPQAAPQLRSQPNSQSHRLNPPDETLPDELSIREAPV